MKEEVEGNCKRRRSEEEGRVKCDKKQVGGLGKREGGKEEERGREDKEEELEES